MITLNSTILSYNKVKEIDEYKPILPPESIYIPEDINNRSFQSFIPDKYDLDKIDFNDIKYQRNSTPITKNKSHFKKYFLNSFMIMNQNQIQSEKKDKYMESLPINIYNNEKSFKINNYNYYDNDSNIMKEEVENTNVYKTQKKKIDDDINNNILKEKDIYNEIKKNNIINNTNKEEYLINKKEKSNVNKGLMDSQKSNSTNIKINNNEIKKIDKKKISDQKSIQSAIVSYNYKNIMRKDPNKENTIIINTSFYKRNKHNNTNNQKNKVNEIKRNSFNSFLKFEESSKDQHFSDLNLNKTQQNKKNEILKQFMNSTCNINNISKLDQSNLNSVINNHSKNNININNSNLEQSNVNNLTNNHSNNNININNSKLEHSNLNSLINNHSNNNININNSKLEQSNIDDSDNISKLNIEENENVSNYDDKKTVKYNNLNKYTFRTGKNGINSIIINQTKVNGPILNNKDQNNNKMSNKSLKYGNNPIINICNNTNTFSGSIKSIKSPITTFQKFNFDFPKMKKGNDYSKDEENISKSFLSNNNKEVNNNNENEIKIEKNNKLINIKYKNLKKIIKNGLFNILTFLDCYDLMNILQTNKSFIFLINRSISNAYYFQIKNNLNKINSDIELLKCSLVYSKVKDALKIDFVINIRFINKIFNKNIKNLGKNDFFTIDPEKNMEPKCFQLLYFYNYFKSINPQKKLKTKENTKKVNMYDYYTYDLYSENDKIPNIYINKEQSLFNNNNISNKTDKLVFIQPILPFKINDKGIINLEIYSSNNNFINPSSIKIFLKSFDLKKYLIDLDLKGYNNLRICEYENICFHWKYINNDRNKNNFIDIINKMKQKFEPYFEIINISYESIGFFIFKINLVAVKPGKIGNNNIIDDDFGINIIIRKKREVVENEIKKNNLLLERREIYELRVGDSLTLYFSTKKIKNKK